MGEGRGEGAGNGKSLPLPLTLTLSQRERELFLFHHKILRNPDRFDAGRIEPLAHGLAFGQRGIAEIAHDDGRIERAIYIDPANQPQNEAAFGARVTIVDEDGQRHSFQIVGEDEANAAEGKVSWVSPLARALVGARVGSIVTWERQAGDKMLRVSSIRYGNGAAASKPMAKPARPAAKKAAPARKSARPAPRSKKKVAAKTRTKPKAKAKASKPKARSKAARKTKRR